MHHLGRILGMLALAVVLFLGGSLLLERYRTPPAVPRNVRAQSDIESLIVALRMYQTYTGDLPTTEQGLQALVQKPTIEPLPRHWRAQVDAPLGADPWGRPFVYRHAADDLSGKFDLFSLGPDGVESADDIRKDSTK